MPSFLHRTRRAALLGGLAAILTLTAGCGGEGAPAPPRHVFLITIDTLRADHMGLHGYPRDTTPFLDQLAGDAVVFDRAIAQWPKTGASMASMFTGRYPQTTGLTHRAALEIPAEQDTLPELFAARGYTTVAVVANAVLSSHLGWDRGFDEYVELWEDAERKPRTPLEWRAWTHAGRVGPRARALIDKYSESDNVFFWLHYIDPHLPYALPEGVENPFLGDEHYRDGPQVGDWFPREALLGDHRKLGYYVAQYDANVLLIDRALRQVLDHAEKRGLLDDSLVVISADHGESLGERDYLGHGNQPYLNGVWVPLVFHWPGGPLTPRRVADPVELIDLYPTLAELLEVDTAPEGLEGRSLVAALTGGAPPATTTDERWVFSEAGGQRWEHYRSIQDERYRLIFHPARPRRDVPLTYELYDLERDPGETRDLFAAERDRARRMRAELFRWMLPDSGTASADGEDASPETLEALRALGYIN